MCIHLVNFYEMLMVEAKLSWRYRNENDRIATLKRPVIHSVIMGDNSPKSLTFGYSEISHSFRSYVSIAHEQ